MRQLVYEVGGMELTSMKRAREIQPDGELKVRLDELEEEKDENTEVAKRLAFVINKRLKMFAEARAARA